MDASSRPVVGVSLKMYFGLEQSRAWLVDVANMARETGLAERLEVFVVPGYLALGIAREVLDGTGVRIGAQDVFWEDSGPYTGEVSAPTLREAGCSYVEVGHAERRRLFGEDDGVTTRKAVAVARAGMIPIVCIGEVERASVDEAVRDCRAHMQPILDAVPGDADLMFAYEPAWAIGAEHPADPERIVEVARQLKETSAGRIARPRLMYGGSAGPGLYGRLAHSVDGLFLGRFVHDVHNFRTVLEEVSREAG